MATLMQPTTGYDVGVERNEGRHADEPGNRVDKSLRPGAGLGDLAAASFSNDVPGLVLSASVTAPDMVTVTLTNETTSDVDLDQGTVFTKVTKASVS
jgi:hypothetical protein